MLLLVGFLLPVVAVSAALCGHVGEAWPPGVWWRALKAARARERGCAPTGVPQGRDPVSDATEAAIGAPRPRTALRPSWATEQPIETKEAA